MCIREREREIGGFAHINRVMNKKKKTTTIAGDRNWKHSGKQTRPSQKCKTENYFTSECPCSTLLVGTAKRTEQTYLLFDEIKLLPKR